MIGTNYYHHGDACEHCGREDEPVHIGKSSGGWSFGFHGTDEIRSWHDWKMRLLSGGRIVDEYGCEMPLDAFEEVVENSRSEKLNHTTYCQVHHPEHAERDCWLDDEGFSFQSGEFS